ncbi:High-affinity methionine permease OS=Saccharomyces cerevisiae (strain ATCC 204508 / S288c) GN=MUP1 PE=1 SV=1 [Rhizoctonia solani AG-1 IB]|uniref:High-affinity methionine permease n=1 Tax=Thanatephorus cucumeris (strain AG1-IB / isolate 7/3/14) TaxID=1108050 RepID=A0A0B7FT41_THACB|nr:High-affinity methionine permease OS=Saccharomyces cerevisiae (strain ATCC 204508 / S288c) GN=MUP1 PE=1 SV=1 [Rhizoctonia solani AG-1 IB]
MSYVNHRQDAVDEIVEDRLDETSLAPVEQTSPLGYNVGFLNATLVNTSAMIGMGIFSTPSYVLKSVGSVGALVTLYLVAPIVTWAGLMVYIELASMCGHKRSGAEVVYLEQAYPKPKYLVSTVFAMTTALLSYTGVSATVFARHILHGFNIEDTPFKQKAIALTMLTSAVATCLFSNKWALRINSFSTVFKVGSLILVSFTGLACLLGWTSVPYTGNLNHPFEGTKIEGNPLATSFAKVNFSFIGWNTILGLMAEVKGRDPVRTVRRAGLASIAITSILFLATILSFTIVLTKEEITNANEVLGALFFRKVYGDTAATKLFPVFIGLNSFGGIVAMTLYYARMLREAGRQGVLPFATFWSRVGRFKTPYGPLLLKWVLSMFLVIATPAGDTFAFLVDLSGYPGLVFALATSCGVWILRNRRTRMGLPEHAYKAPNIVVLAYVVKSIALIVMPWIPPEGGSHGGDVDFFYAMYCIVALAVMMLCVFYYWVWFRVLPEWFGYEIIEETVTLPGGVKAAVLRKRYKGEREPLLQAEEA